MSLYVSMSCTDSLYKGRARGGAAASGLAMADDQGGGGGERARECGPQQTRGARRWVDGAVGSGGASTCAGGR